MSMISPASSRKAQTHAAPQQASVENVEQTTSTVEHDKQIKALLALLALIGKNRDNHKHFGSKSSIYEETGKLCKQADIEPQTVLGYDPQTQTHHFTDTALTAVNIAQELGKAPKPHSTSRNLGEIILLLGALSETLNRYWKNGVAKYFKQHHTPLPPGFPPYNPKLPTMGNAMLGFVTQSICEMNSWVIKIHGEKPIEHSNKRKDRKQDREDSEVSDGFATPPDDSANGEASSPDASGISFNQSHITIGTI